jgi:hypothetical protein
MKKILGLTLGIMTALGGFVDLGQIVFTTQAGALFGYKLLWTIVLGTIAIIVYMEMCGRVAVVVQEPVFAVVRTRLGYKLGLASRHDIRKDPSAKRGGTDPRSRIKQLGRVLVHFASTFHRYPPDL